MSLEKPPRYRIVNDQWVEIIPFLLTEEEDGPGARPNPDYYRAPIFEKKDGEFVKIESPKLEVTP